MTAHTTVHEPSPVITAQALAAMNDLAQFYDQQGMRLSCRCCGKGAIACHYDKPMLHQPTCLQREDLFPWQRFFSATDVLRRSVPITKIDGDNHEHPQTS